MADVPSVPAATGGPIAGRHRWGELERFLNTREPICDEGCAASRSPGAPYCQKPLRAAGT